MFDVYIVFALLLEWWLTPDGWARPKAPINLFLLRIYPFADSQI